MNNIAKTILFSLLIIGFNASSQDYILKVNTSTKKQDCKNISINNDTIYCSKARNLNESTTTVSDIYGINFNENNLNELLLLSFQTDTIKCTIDSISSKDIYYRDSDRLLNKIDINDVFCILFESNTQILQIDSFYNQYIAIQKQKYNSTHKLFKKNGKELLISRNISIANDTASVQLLIKKRLAIDTYLRTSALNSIIYKEPADKLSNRYFDDYILSKEGKLYEVSINRFYDNMINFRTDSKISKFTLEQNKNSIVGIFFYNYRNPVIEKEEEEEIIVIAKKIEKKPKVIFDIINSKYMFDISSGFGNMLKLDKTFELAEEDNTYLNKLSLGFTFDANFKMFIIRNFGLGIKYNFFHTTSTAQSVLSEKISIHFLGGTIFGNIPIVRNKGVFTVDLSLGLLAKNEHFDLYEQSYYMKGKTIGYYVSSGLDFFIKKNITLGFKLGLLGGSLEKTDITSDYDVVLDNPSYLNRFDGMVKIKYYFQ